MKRASAIFSLSLLNLNASKFRIPIIVDDDSLQNGNCFFWPRACLQIIFRSLSLERVGQKLPRDNKSSRVRENRIL